MTDADCADRLLSGMHAVAASHDGALMHPFLADWPAVPPRRLVSRATLPVLAFVPHLVQPHVGALDALVSLVMDAAGQLDWRQTYGATDFGAAFLDRYGWTEIIGQRGAFASERLAAGFLLLGPQTIYPLHSHDAEEIYIPLSGTAEWARDSEGWHVREPGVLIHHPSRVPHAMKTGEEPLLALYLWRAGDLTQKSVITAHAGEMRPPNTSH